MIMENKLDLSQKILCNKVGKMFAAASEKLNYYEISFCKEWLHSELCRSIIDMDETIICQSHIYFLNSLKMELNLPEHPGYKMDRDVMYWAGYIFTYWMYMRGVDGPEIVNGYDIKSILEDYDTLHTMSSRAEIRSIEKEYCLTRRG